jgi:drug/metabolite transporter (DMT)-like permease
MSGRWRDAAEFDVRIWALLYVVVALSGCSWAGSPEVAAGFSVSKPPTVAALKGGIMKAFDAAKLTGTPEVSPLRRALLSAPGDWITCLRGAGKNGAHPYAVFFNGDTLVTYRVAVLLDACQREPYAPMPK